MVGGLHPTLDKRWYLDLLTRLRALDPQLQLKAFTAIEIRHLARRIFKTSIPETLAILREAGLGSLTGGGAEIFDPECAMNCAGGRRAARSGLKSIGSGTKWAAAAPAPCSTDMSRRTSKELTTCGNCANYRTRRRDSPASSLSLSSRRRTSLSRLPRATAFEQLRNLAVSRIYLDNFDHLTAYWVSMGLPLAQVALGLRRG